jgi:hypothetical protein
VGRLDDLQELRQIVVLREMKGVEHRLKLHPGSTFRQIYQRARAVLGLPPCKSSTSLSLFYSENLLGARRPCTWEALAQVPCHNRLCSRWLAGTFLISQRGAVKLLTTQKGMSQARQNASKRKAKGIRKWS